MNFISLIRFFATIFITNSHFDALYPAGLAMLSTGGALGNMLFFLVSGYTLCLSRRDDFGEWIFRRYSRIYPSAWLFFLVVLITGIGTVSLADVLFLEKFWFLNAIIVFYPAFFLALKFLGKRIWILLPLLMIPWLATFSMVPHDAYVIESGTLCLRWYPYFGVMILGALLAQKTAAFPSEKSPRKILFALGNGGGLLALYYATILALPKIGVPAIQLAAPIFLSGAVIFFFFAAKNICAYRLPRKISAPIATISTMTLDIYIVQFVIIEMCSALRFPYGFATATILIFFAARILGRAAEKFHLPSQKRF